MAGLIGLLIGAFVMFLVLQARETARRAAAQAPTLDDQVIDVLTLVHSGGIVVGEHDEVTYSTAQARNFGLVRGTRIGSPDLLEAVRRARRSQQMVSLDLALHRGIGVPQLHLAAKVAPMRTGSILVLAEDRGARARIDETRRDFVANVTHELKTPIGAVSLLAEAIEEAADDPGAVRHFAARMYNEAVRLNELVVQIIELSRLQSDDPLLSAQVVSTGEIIHEAVNRHRELAAKRKVQLHIVGDTNPQVVGDAGQLADAIGNLIQNAIAYSDPGARVAVSTRVVTEDDDQVVEISVADNGIGIKPEDLDRIFERFYRVDYARSRESGGTGLGLAIVKHIAAAHGGSVNVWSRVGQGSTFTLRLPAHLPVPPAGHDAGRRRVGGRVAARLRR